MLYGKHAYSVPHALVGSHIDIEAGARLFASITGEHWLPSIHRRNNRAASPCRQDICRGGLHLHHRAHPEQAYRTCLGLLNLSREYGDARLENACQQALLLERPWRQVILNLLTNHRERLKDEAPNESPCRAQQCTRCRVLSLRKQ